MLLSARYSPGQYIIGVPNSRCDILPAMIDIAPYLEETAALHNHLCPRQVLGVRMGLYAGAALGLLVPQNDKRLLAFVETDGCFADGVSVATGCRLGRRTMRLVDYGKAAATLIDTLTERALRISPGARARELALRYAADAPDSWHAQLEAYQTMPDEELLSARPVRLTVSLRELISRPGLRVPCEECGEEVMNEREVIVGGRALCRACTGQGAYYERLEGLDGMTFGVTHPRSNAPK